MISNINYILGIAGLFLLMITVAIEKRNRRKWWLASAALLVIYNMVRRDWINTGANAWIIGVNMFYLAKWQKRKNGRQKSRGYFEKIF